MHISKLSLINYRNFANTKLLFNKGVNTIIGENGSGKTNIFRAIRLLLDENMIRSAYKLDEQDFNRGLEKWQGHWIIISLEFEDISPDESIQALFLHPTGNISDNAVGKATYNLIFRPKMEIRLRLSQLAEGDKEGLEKILYSITIDDYETIFTGRSDADFNSETFYNEVVGDFDNVKFNKEMELPCLGIKIPKILSIEKEISFTFVQALRDVVSEFHNNRTNPLLTLLKSRSGQIDDALFRPIIEKVKDLNDSIEGLPDVQTVRTDITNTIKHAAGETYSPSSLSIRSELSNEADRLFQSLRLFVGESEEVYEGAVHELSLGGANLIYLTLKLLEFKYQKTKQSFANFLLIEEPEAHIHTHIQKTLFDKLNYDDTQIIYSTHSAHISEVSNVENMNILGREKSRCKAYQPAKGLSPIEIRNIQRYLDAVRSNLLFAKSIILVEGDAEEILIPILIKKVLGISLDELGISLINIRSTGFKNVAILFHDDRIQKKCSIITDLDTSIIDTAPVASDADPVRRFKEKCLSSQEVGKARKAALESFMKDSPWVDAFFAHNTFEVDFITAGNANKVIDILSEVYTNPGTIKEAKEDLESSNIAVYGRRILTIAAKEGKGWFAILLGRNIDYKTIIPDYILNAIRFAHSHITREIWFNILSYRLGCIEKDSVSFLEKEKIANFRAKLDEFKAEAVDFSDIQSKMYTEFPDDQINQFLKGY